MDPNACMARMMEAIAAGDCDETLEALQDLSEWITKGGALPDGSCASRAKVEFLEMRG